MPPKPAAAAADEVESQFERLNLGAGAAASSSAAASAAPLTPVAAAAVAAVTQASASTPVTVSAEDQRLINGCVSVMLALIDKLQAVSARKLIIAAWQAQHANSDKWKNKAEGVQSLMLVCVCV
jgi:hypothetical protein